MEKKTVGLIETVELRGVKAVKTPALFDTGANLTSVDTELASKVQLGPVVRVSHVKNPSRKERITRPVVRVKIVVGGRVFDTEVNLQDRSHMKFPVIIGRNILAGNFLVDCEKNAHLFKRPSRKLREE